MNSLVDAILICLVLTNLLVLGSSRLGVYIRIVAIQGIMLSILFLVGQNESIDSHTIFIAAVTMLIKGALFPWLLFRVVRDTGVKREIQPFVGFNFSLFIGMGVWAFSLWLGKKLPMPISQETDLIFPVAIFTAFVGMFLIMSRKTAITQVLGYLVLENGIYTFATAINSQQPLIVELGILLDIFVAVFIMVLTLFQINREIGEIRMDTTKLAALKD
jgi:hydrogenase-4 component E